MLSGSMNCKLLWLLAGFSGFLEIVFFVAVPGLLALVHTQDVFVKFFTSLFYLDVLLFQG